MSNDKTAEDLLAHNLGVSKETILANPDATLTVSEAIEFANVYSEQQLKVYKEALSNLFYWYPTKHISESNARKLIDQTDSTK